jgi:hypothetical protein
MVYSSNEESDDILVDLVARIRKKKQKSRKKENSDSDSESEEEQSQSSRKRRRREQKHKESVLSKVDNILAPEKQPKPGARALSKIDDILFSDITNSEFASKKSFLSEVDKILDLGNNSESDGSDTVDTSDNENTDETDKDDDEDELSESEMRLLNLINIKKIDMKHNFPSAYPDTLCHFCRYVSLSPSPPTM